MSDSGDVVGRFILNYFESYSLEETLIYCVQMLETQPRQLEKLIVAMRDVAVRSPQTILDAFLAIDQIPLHHPDGESQKCEEVTRLFLNVVLFLEDEMKERRLNTSRTTVKIREVEFRKRVKVFCERLRIDFDGRLGI